MEFSSEPVVSVKSADIYQENQVVLNNIAFNINKGEFTYLIGRTGSGKSSLLKTIYADLPLRSGEVQVAGVNIMGIKRKQIPHLRRKIGLGAVSSKMPHQLSGGEQQRVVIARALINEPSILIADEPTGNLDPRVSDDIFKLFLEINRSGTAVLMATHNHTFLTNYPARVLKCEAGKVLDSEIEDFELTGYY